MLIKLSLSSSTHEITNAPAGFFLPGTFVNLALAIKGKTPVLLELELNLSFYVMKRAGHVVP